MTFRTKVLVGSRAISHWFSDYPCKPGDDFDWIVEGHRPSGNFENSVNDEKYVGDNPALLYILQKNVHIVNFQHLYTLAMSMAFFDINWSKNMDRILFLQNQNLREDSTLCQALYKGWKAKYGNSKKFMDNSRRTDEQKKIETRYCHGDIHQAVAYFNKPLCTVVTDKRNHATVNKILFDSLPFEHKLKLCREEIYTVALEKFLIPNNFSVDEKIAYKLACRHIITSRNRGFWPMFIVRNWVDLHEPDNHPWVARYKKAKKHGRIRKTSTVNKTLEKLSNEGKTKLKQPFMKMDQKTSTAFQNWLKHVAPIGSVVSFAEFQKHLESERVNLQCSIDKTRMKSLPGRDRD